MTLIGLDLIFNEIQLVKTDFEMIDILVDKKMMDGWKSYLEKFENPANYILAANKDYNLLSTLFYASFELKNNTEFAPYKHAVKLIITLNNYLLKFENLVKSNSFRTKIKAINGFDFFSTMSELSISNKFLSLGNSIEFDIAYTKSNSRKRDIDIKISNKEIGDFFFEVYSPNENLEIDGFFDPTEFSKKLNRKISTKSHDKFSGMDKKDILGKRLLAVNILYNQGIMINYHTLNIESFFLQLVNILPEEIDGLIIFSDDFSSLHSYNELKTIIKVRNG